MPKIKVYNLEGKEVSEIDLVSKIFDVPVKQEVVHQVVIAQLSNARKVLAHTKTKGEVRGGGKKPWRQKGTGRARQGSIRSPLWVGGGIVFGPLKERNFSKKVNKKIKKKALAMVLTDKIKDNNFIVVEKLEVPDAKTKKLIEMLKKFPTEKKKILMVISKKDDNILRSGRNIRNVEIIKADSLNVVDILNNNIVFTDLDSIKKIEEVFKM